LGDWGGNSPRASLLHSLRVKGHVVRKRGRCDRNCTGDWVREKQRLVIEAAELDIKTGVDKVFQRREVFGVE